MSDPIREQIIDRIISRMAIIREANGFKTDCGEHVFRAAKRIDPSELDAVSVFPRRETAVPEYSAVKPTMPVDVQLIQAVAVVEGEAESTRAARVAQMIETMLADAIEAMTGDRWSVPFTSGSREPVAGETITGATSTATGYVESVALTGGTWTGGNAAGTITFRRKTGTFASENLNIAALLDVCTINGVVTCAEAKALVTNNLSDGIYYESGGADEYPDPADGTVGVIATFNITYPVKAGNPYAQP